jgi:hypothetical protein
MNIMKFIRNNLPYCALNIGYKEMYTEETVNTEYFGVKIYKHLNWKNLLLIWFFS